MGNWISKSEDCESKRTLLNNIDVSSELFDRNDEGIVNTSGDLSVKQRLFEFFGIKTEDYQHVEGGESDYNNIYTAKLKKYKDLLKTNISGRIDKQIQSEFCTFDMYAIHKAKLGSTSMVYLVHGVRKMKLGDMVKENFACSYIKMMDDSENLLNRIPNIDVWKTHGYFVRELQRLFPIYLPDSNRLFFPASISTNINEISALTGLSLDTFVRVDSMMLFVE